MRVLRVRRRLTQSGFSLLEILIAISVLIILFGALASLYTQYNRYRVIASSRIKLQQVMAEATRQLKIDIQTAALSTETPPLVNAQRFLVKDSKSRPQPGIFIDIDSGNNSITAIHTANIGAGEIVKITGNSLVITRMDKDQVAGLKRGNLFFCVRSAGSPAMLELTGKPRQATITDLSGLLALYNLERTFVFNTTTPPSCIGIAGLSTTPTVGDNVVTIDRVVKYSLMNQELFRQETVGCTLQPQLISQNYSPGTQCRIRYQYSTTNGPVLSLPGDIFTLQGIQTELTLTDPTTGLTETVTFDTLVQPWRKP